MKWLFRAREERGRRWDPRLQTPAMRCSICTGERVAGFRDRESGRFTEVSLIRDEKDLEEFRRAYGIEGPIETFY